MDKQKWLDLAGYAAIGCSAYFSGAALYINMVQVPTMFAVAPDTKTLLKEWRETFTRARVIQGGLAVLGTASGLTVYYFTDRGQYRYLWLAGALTLLSGMPWTKLVMMPDINKLKEEDILERKGETWIREKIARWNRLHGFRTITSGLAFNLMMAAVYLDRMM
ncbi:uncharacterized protein LOC133187734 [Saccostrea echinata]|uniref:uncharacterized protein LOC133187734 n=1 Tax=Saccostrea echinata TaxID=191078 RepID=UPI002A8181E5|nr:uncharacterized protein LOC133187734 [Saccostrea echinata]